MGGKMLKTFFKYQDLDAKVCIATCNSYTIVSFLAKGNSQIKKSGLVVGHKRRNPDRKAMVDRLLPLLPNAYIVRYGSKNVPPVKGDIDPATMRKLYSKGGNFQFDIAIKSTNLPTYPALEACPGRAIKNFLGE